MVVSFFSSQSSSCTIIDAFVRRQQKKQKKRSAESIHVAARDSNELNEQYLKNKEDVM